MTFHNPLTAGCIALAASLILSASITATAQTASVPSQTPAQAAEIHNLTVERAIELALQHNREIGIAEQDVKHYKALKDQVRAEYFPKIKNDSTASYITDREGVVLPSGSFGKLPATGPIPARTVRIDQGALSNYYSITQIVQPVTQLFAVHASNHAARANVEKSEEQVKQTKLDVALEVRRLFYGVIVAQKQQEVAVVSLAAAEQAEHEANRNVAQGSALPASELSARAQVESARSDQQKANSSALDALLALEDQLGLALSANLKLVPPAPLETPASNFPSLPEATQRAIAAEPQVHMAERAVEEAKASLRVAQDAYIPNVSFNAHESYQDGLAFFNRNYGVFAADFSYDVFDGGARSAKIRDAKALLSKAELALAQLRSKAEIAVAVTYDQVKEALADLNAKQLSAQSQTEAARVAESQFTLGELLQSKRDEARAGQASAEAALLESALNLSLARSQVLKALGEIPR